jgi:exopolyphosphatase/guanosine-5'-triphosphate,3'-diphosphate pyrophosphatase
MRMSGVRVLGTSGTVTTLAGVALGLTKYRRPAVDGQILTEAAATEALAALRGLGRDGLARHPCVGPDRAAFVLPGCAIFEAIRTVWPVAEVMVADRGLREGMLLRMMRGRK